MSLSDRILLVVDDVGMPTVYADGTGAPIPLAAYERVLRLAESRDLTIPMGVPAAYLSPEGERFGVVVNARGAEVVALLRDNSRRLPVWNHGLNHRFLTWRTEFLDYATGRAPAADEQERHLRLSQEILAELGLGRPRVFIPPGHGWQPDTTDRLARRVGLEAICLRAWEKTPVAHWLRRPSRRYWRRWELSRHLASLPRLGLGLPAAQTAIGRTSALKSRLFIHRPAPARWLIQRTFSHSWRPHHFFAHIQNFSSSRCLAFWERTLDELEEFFARLPGGPGEPSVAGGGGDR